MRGGLTGDVVVAGVIGAAFALVALVMGAPGWAAVALIPVVAYLGLISYILTDIKLKLYDEQGRGEKDQ